MATDRRVYELANDLGMDKQELVTKINELKLGIIGINVMTRLSSEEVDRVKKALKKDGAKKEAGEVKAPKARAASPSKKEAASAAPAKRDASEAKGPKTRTKAAEPEVVAEEAVAAPPTIIRRSRSKSEDAEQVEQASTPDLGGTRLVRKSHSASADDTAEPVEASAPVEEKVEPVVVSAPAPVEVAPEVVKPEPVEVKAAAPVVEAEVKVEPKAEPVATPAPEEASQPVEAAATTDAAAPVAAEATTPEGEAVEAPRAISLDMSEERARGSQAKANSSGGAKVLGTIDPALLQRLNVRSQSGTRGRDDSRGPSRPADNRGPSDNRGPATDNRGPARPADDRGPRPATDNRGPARPADNRGPSRPSDNRGPGSGPGFNNSQQPSSPAPAAERKGGRPGGRTVVDKKNLYDRDDRFGGRKSRGKNERALLAQRNRAKQQEIAPTAEHKRVIRIEDAVTVGDMAHQMGVKAAQLALKLLQLGVPAMVNTTIDYETASLIAEEFGYTVENVAFDISRFYDTTPDPEDKLLPRPPVVTVMGHVDHGKTSLLDAIRSTTVTTSEAGGITQHIGAYTVKTRSGDPITFLDTPGHEAFTALRARGAQVTDLVVLVVAADDGVMPQTVEAINHAKDANVPIIVAVNKIDKPAANADRVKHALVEYGLQPEEWGGQTIFVEVSALKGIKIQELIDSIQLQAEVLELKANPTRDAQGVVIEAQIDTGRGPTATVLVRRGTMRRGEIVVIGEHYGRVRTMVDHLKTVQETAGPSIPVEITGLSGVPEAGEPFFVVQDERDAKRITEHVSEVNRKERMAMLAKNNMDKLRDLLRPMEGGERASARKKLKVIVKADVQGSVEALRAAFSKLGNDEVSIDVIHAAVGAVTENDVNLAASSSDSAVVIIGFNMRPDVRAQDVAEQYGVQIYTFSIIYDAIDQLKALLEGMLSPLKQEKVLGHAEVRETYQVPKVGTVAGCYVTDGFIRRNARARLLRNGRVVYESSLGSLRRFKDDVREVKSGFECGTSLDNYNDIKLGDVIEVFEIEEVAAKLN
jgi:translation initiation factor IF-2